MPVMPVPYKGLRQLMLRGLKLSLTQPMLILCSYLSLIKYRLSCETAQLAFRWPLCTRTCTRFRFAGRFAGHIAARFAGLIAARFAAHIAGCESLRESEQIPQRIRTGLRFAGFTFSFSFNYMYASLSLTTRSSDHTARDPLIGSQNCQCVE